MMLAAWQCHAEGLKSYLERPDSSFAWEEQERLEAGQSTVYRLRLESQEWRGVIWKHKLDLIVPESPVQNETCLLFLTSNSGFDGDPEFYRSFAARVSSVVAVLSSIPNQPLLENRKEDALIAYSFRKFIDSGDAGWPVIFPMVKSVHRAMDALQAFSPKAGLDLKKFVISGSSKRGWTTYLTAATDKRVAGIAPMVFDMLNMRQQIELAKRSYGKESEKIRNYTEMGLIEKIDQPRTVQLRRWVDPYEYRSTLQMPKFILLGTNDPYWVVDSQLYYFSDLPGKNLILQVPNGNHHISRNEQLLQSLSIWYRTLAGDEGLPMVEWKHKRSDRGGAKISLSSSEEFTGTAVWQAHSLIRDFRDAKWKKRDLMLKQGAQAEFTLDSPATGYSASVFEIEMPLEAGKIKVSSPAYVTCAEKIKVMTPELCL